MPRPGGSRVQAPSRAREDDVHLFLDFPRSLLPLEDEASISRVSGLVSAWEVSSMGISFAGLTGLLSGLLVEGGPVEGASKSSSFSKSNS